MSQKAFVKTLVKHLAVGFNDDKEITSPYEHLLGSSNGFKWLNRASEQQDVTNRCT